MSPPRNNCLRRCILTDHVHLEVLGRQSLRLCIRLHEIDEFWIDLQFNRSSVNFIIPIFPLNTRKDIKTTHTLI